MRKDDKVKIPPPKKDSRPTLVSTLIIYRITLIFKFLLAIVILLYVCYSI